MEVNIAQLKNCLLGVAVMFNEHCLLWTYINHWFLIHLLRLTLPWPWSENDSPAGPTDKTKCRNGQCAIFHFGYFAEDLVAQFRLDSGGQLKLPFLQESWLHITFLILILLYTLCSIYSWPDNHHYSFRQRAHFPTFHCHNWHEFEIDLTHLSNA